MISIVIPVKNGRDRLPRVLEAINAQVVVDDIETLVVDSGSTDGTQEVARAMGARVHEIPAKEFNHGGTRNLGAELTLGEILVFTVDDALPHGDQWLSSLVAPLKGSPEVAGAYARQVAYRDAPPHQAYYIEYRYGPEPRTQRVSGPGDLSVGNVLFSNVSSAIRRSVFDEFHFATDIVIAEDLEWASRVLLAGYEIAYAPDSVVSHSHQYTHRDTVKRYFDQGAAASRSYLGADRSDARSVRGEGLRFIRSELGWLLRSGNGRHVPAALVHEGARFAGYQLGVHHHRVPNWLRRRISRTAVYWSD